MAAMRKFNVCSSESKNGKITVNFACVYHYHSYLGLHFPLSQTWAPRIFKLSSSLSNQWNMMFLFAISSYLMPAYFHIPHFLPGHLRCLFILFYFLIQSPHCMNKGFVATEQGILCRAVSPSQNHVTVAGQGLGCIVGEYSVCSAVRFVLLKHSGIPLPPYLCDASIDIAKNFTLLQRER